MTSDAELIEAIGSSLHMYPPVPGLAEDLGVPGVRGRVTTLSSPLLNLVGSARLDEETADATILRVTQRFAREHKAYGWVVDPLTTPRDLPTRLETAGLQPIAQLAGMVLTDLATPIAAAPAVHVREVTPAEMERDAAMMGRAYGMPVPAAAMFAKLMGFPPIRTRAYFAYLDGPEPIAWSYLVYLPDSPIVLLGGAATVPEARGKGTYTALVKQRLDDARADGRTAAIIQADRDTSAPICAKLGFRELCSLTVFAWSPESPRP